MSRFYVSAAAAVAAAVAADAAGAKCCFSLSVFRCLLFIAAPVAGGKWCWGRYSRLAAERGVRAWPLHWWLERSVNRLLVLLLLCTMHDGEGVSHDTGMKAAPLSDELGSIAAGRLPSWRV